MVYVAFVIDMFSRRIVGWKAGTRTFMRWVGIR
jgi:transposase InsO family protein